MSGAVGLSGTRRAWTQARCVEICRPRETVKGLLHGFLLPHPPRLTTSIKRRSAFVCARPCTACCGTSHDLSLSRSILARINYFACSTFCDLLLAALRADLCQSFLQTVPHRLHEVRRKVAQTFHTRPSSGVRD